MKAESFCGFSCALVFHTYKEKSAPFHRLACAAAVAAFKNGLHIFGGKSAPAHVYKGAGDGADHIVQKAVARDEKGEQFSAFALFNVNVVDCAHGGFAPYAFGKGEGAEVVLAGKAGARLFHIFHVEVVNADMRVAAL